MKFPSLFKTPDNQRFKYMPRYYDEVKEDIENRTRRIRQQLELEGVLQSEEGEEDSEFKSRITGSFSRRAYYKSSKNKAAFIQSVIFVVLVSIVGGYLLYGNNVLYIALLAIPAYLYYKLKKR